jgi:hypothetical protein
MDLQTELSYAASTDEVFAMLCDEAFRGEVCESTLATSHEVAITEAPQGTTVRVTRRMPAPDIARRFVGSTLEIVHVEQWGGAAPGGTRRAKLTVELPGKPASMVGAVDLAPADGGTLQTISGVVKVKIPMIGGRLEKELARAILAAVREEGKVGRRWLAR